MCDFDDKRIKAIENGVTTFNIGNYFEWTGSTDTMKKYYYAGSTRVAVRTGTGTGSTGLSLLLGDQIGSTSITTNSSGVRTGELLYKPWGENRYTYGVTPTSFRFTGQREDSNINLYWYGSRWYDDALGRFISPDSDVPESQGPQAWDRYAYVNNSPVNYTDPTGHRVDDGCSTEGCSATQAEINYDTQRYNYQNCKSGAGGGCPDYKGAIAFGVVSLVTLGVAGPVLEAVGGEVGGAVYDALLVAGSRCTATPACARLLGLNPDSINHANILEQNAINTTTAIQTYYPPNMGFSGSPQLATLQPGTLLSRFGSTYGEFLSTAGTPTWASSLPPGVENLPLSTYEVVQPIENVLSGTAATWFGQIGGGIQYYIGTPYGQNVKTLLNSGYLIQK